MVTVHLTRNIKDCDEKKKGGELKENKTHGATAERKYDCSVGWTRLLCKCRPIVPSSCNSALWQWWSPFSSSFFPFYPSFSPFCSFYSLLSFFSPPFPNSQVTHIIKVNGVLCLSSASCSIFPFRYFVICPFLSGPSDCQIIIDHYWSLLILSPHIANFHLSPSWLILLSSKTQGKCAKHICNVIL